MDAEFNFQRLEIYNISLDIVLAIYAITKVMPAEERFGLASQMNRAAVSVPSNIAEGVARRTIKDKVHFINIAYGSLMELVAQVQISVKLEYAEIVDAEAFYKKAKNLSVKMTNYISAMERR